MEQDVGLLLDKTEKSIYSITMNKMLNLLRVISARPTSWQPEYCFSKNTSGDITKGVCEL